MKNKQTYNWYNDGKSQIQVRPGEQVPSGFVRGRLPRSQHTIDAFKETWRLKCDEEKKLINRKRAETYKKTLASMPTEKIEEAKNKRIATMRNKTPEQLDEYRRKLSVGSVGKNKGNIPWNKGLTKSTNSSVAHTSEILHTYMKNVWASRTKDDAMLWRSKMRATMHENGNAHTSKPEDNLYSLLCEKYGCEDVIRHYSDYRYPFECDFYIPSEDLFIELNRHPSHGEHPFDPQNLEDVEKLNELMSIGDRWSKMIIDVWAKRDVEKLKIAKQNGLNYIVIY